MKEMYDVVHLLLVARGLSFVVVSLALVMVSVAAGECVEWGRVIEIGVSVFDVPLHMGATEEQ